MKAKRLACSERLSDSFIKCEEKGKKAVFENENRVDHDRTRVDGCMMNNVLCADFVVSKIGVGDIVVELKGKDVSHGIEQVTATAQLYADNKLHTTGKIAALIVAKSCPSFNSAVRKGKEQFAKRFKGPLHVVTKNDTFVFERVLDFKGPR